MDHREASAHLCDNGRQALEPEIAASMNEHIARCRLCQRLVAAQVELRRAIQADREVLFDEHPDSADLVQFAVDADSLPAERRVALSSHLDTCPTCRHESEVARGAHAHRSFGWRGTLEELLAPPGRRAWAPSGTAFAAASLALACIAAYLWFVRLPSLRSERDMARSEVEISRERESQLETALRTKEAELLSAIEWAGPARALILSAATRAGGETPRADLLPDQRVLPIYLALDLGDRDRWSAADSLVLELRDGTARALWRMRSTVREVWDPDAEAVSLVVPTRLFTSGPFVLIAESPGRLETRQLFRFEVGSESGSPGR